MLLFIKEISARRNVKREPPSGVDFVTTRKKQNRTKKIEQAENGAKRRG